MAEHLELVAEIPKVEKLTVQERLEYAKKRRKQQLKRWEREKDSDNGPPPRKKKCSSKPLTFEPQFMLLDAATRGDVDEVKTMLENGVDPNISNDDGLTALHQACIDGCEEIIDVLLDKGAQLDSVDRELWTPLHAASACGNDDIVEYLLDQGSNIVALNADGNMAIDLVDDENQELKEILQAEMEEQGYTEEKLNELKDLQEQRMLSDLKQKLEEDDDFDLDMSNEQGATVVHTAAANAYEEVLEFLLEQGVAIDIADKDGWQPIHGAAVWGNETTVEMLVENGADLDAKTHTGDTPLTLCEDPELQQFLVDLKKKVKTNKAKSSKRKRSNSRSLSVKRTSLKDKITISQNEAKAEAILRVHPQLAFLLPKGTELKKSETKPMDTTPAATEGEPTSNTITTNTTRQEEPSILTRGKEKENIDPSPIKTLSLSRGRQKKDDETTERDATTSSLNRRRQNDMEDRQREAVSPKVNKSSSLNRGRQKVDIEINEKENVNSTQSSSIARVKQHNDPTPRDSGDNTQEKTTVVEKRPSLKITVKTRTMAGEEKKGEMPPKEAKPDITLETKDVIAKMPYDKHPSNRTRQQEPDVTIGTQRIHDNHVPTRPPGQPDVTMVNKPSTLPRDASTSRPSGALSVGNNLGAKSSSDLNISARTNRMPGQNTSGNFTQAGRGGESSLNKTPSMNDSDHGGPPKSSKARHAPPPPVTRSSGSLSRSHEPADTSGYPDSFSKRSRASRENIMDVVSTGRLASPSKTVAPTDVKLEPAASPTTKHQQQPQQTNTTQNNKQQTNQKEHNRQPASPLQNNTTKPTQLQPKQQPQPKQQQQQQQPKQQQQQQPKQQPASPIQNNTTKPTQPQPKQQQPKQQEQQPKQQPASPLQNNTTKPTQPQQQPKQPSNQQLNNSSHPKQTQNPPQFREQKPNKQEHPRESYRRRSSSEALAVVNNVQVKDDKQQEKKTCCVLM